MAMIEVIYAGGACPERDARILEACGLDHLADEGECDGVRDLTFMFDRGNEIAAATSKLRALGLTYHVERLP